MKAMTAARYGGPETMRLQEVPTPTEAADDPGAHAFHDNVHTGQPGNDDRGTDFDKSANEAERCDTVE